MMRRNEDRPFTIVAASWLACCAAIACSDDGLTSRQQALNSDAETRSSRSPVVPEGYRLVRTLREHDYENVEARRQRRRAELALAQARERGDAPQPDLEPLAKMSRRELAEAFRGVLITSDGVEYEQSEPNWKVADAVIEARSRKGEVPEPRPGGGHTNAAVTEELEGHAVFGTDTRVRKRDNTSYPWSAFGTMGGGCTVTMIDATTAITAAHCMHSGQKWFTKDAISFGVDNADSTTKPFGTESSYNRQIPTAWKNGDTSTVYDYGVIDFSPYGSPGNDTGWLGVWAAQNGHFAGFSALNVYGYPCNLADDGVTTCPGGTCFAPTLWGTHSDWYGARSAQEIKHQVDTHDCQSGSAVYDIDAGDRYIIGIHTGYTYNMFEGGWFNIGRRVDSALLTSIEDWSTWNRDGASVGHPWAP
jgi:V8-like Glu-specific endopeptidase